MTGWNLPPGCTDQMVDEAMGGTEPPLCRECDADMADDGGSWVCTEEGCSGEIRYERDPDEAYEAARERRWSQ